MNARALVLSAILFSPAAAAQAQTPAPAPPDPGPPGTSPVSPEDDAYCESRCRSRAGCFDDERCRVYREREAGRSAPGAER